MYDVNTLSAGEVSTPMLGAAHVGDVIKKGGPYTYFRRKLPEAGQEADALMDWQPLSFSPIGPTHVNLQQVIVQQPTILGWKTLGIQSPGVVANQGTLVSQALIDMSGTNTIDNTVF